MLESALRAARIGPIFPLAEGTKGSPLLANWPALATQDEKLIAAQWGPNGTPTANIAVHCAGLIVVDVDVRKGGAESFAQLDSLLGFPVTCTTRTPSGGRHVFLKLPAGHPGVPNSVELLGKGLDIRSTNGYVVAPGSVTEAGQYVLEDEAPIAPAPGWLILKLGTIIPKAATTDVPDAPDASVLRAQQWLRSAERSVKGQGGDQAAYRVACRLRDLGMSEQQTRELMRSEAWDYGCGWRDNRLEEKPIASAYKYSQNETGGTRGVVEDDLPIPDLSQPVEIKPKKKRGRLILADDFANEEGAGPGYVIKNLLQRSSYAVVFGPPGAGKSFLLLDAGYHVANEKRWMDMNVKGGPVLYLAFEGYGGLKKRTRALRSKYGKLGALYLVNATMNLREQAGRQELGAIMAELPAKPALVIIDTFARALMGGDENSAQDVGALNDAIAKLIDATGACVLLVHHSGKNKAAGARGSSAILGAIDTEIEIDYGLVKPTKQRDLEILPPFAFKLRPVVVGIDSDQEEEKSCVVEAGPSTAHASRPLSPKGEHVFSVVSELTSEANNPVPRSRVVAKLQDEGFGRSAAHEWVRKLEKFAKIAIENDYVTRRLH